MKVVIVGGGYAGVACAVRLARKARQAGHRPDIVLVNPSERFVERIRLHQRAAGLSVPQHRLVDLLAQVGVRLQVGYASAIDTRAQILRVGALQLPWDRLVLAMGSSIGRAQVPGAGLHAFSLSAEHADRIAGRLADLPAGASVAVVGAGLTGIEAATEIQENHPRLSVHLFSAGPFAEGWSESARARLRLVLASLAIRLHEGVRVSAIDRSALTATDGRWAADLCLWTAGFALPVLPRDSGLRVNSVGQVLVDPQLRSVSHPSIYAAGDLAAPLVDPGQALPMGCKSALPTGAHVADNLNRELGGSPPQAFDFALPFYCLSLGRREGLIQWPDEQGRPLGRVLDGAEAAQYKESVCRATWQWLQQEAGGTEALRWLRTGHAPAELPRTFAEEPTA